jgi:hypothetical protein
MSVTVDCLFEPTWKFLHHFVSCQSFQQLVHFMSHMVESLNNFQDEMNTIQKVALRGVAVQHILLRKGATSIIAPGVERNSASNCRPE